jgi:hypothetical protein
LDIYKNCTNNLTKLCCSDNMKTKLDNLHYKNSKKIKKIKIIKFMKSQISHNFFDIPDLHKLVTIYL